MERTGGRRISLRELDMAPAELDALIDELRSVIEAYGFELEDGQARLCVEHLLYVLQVNESINLTSITDVHEGLVLHILDSLVFVRFVPEDASRFLDMGTGAGYPGIPFHVVTGCSGVLLDSVGKKVTAVELITRQLGLSGLSCVHDRLETCALDEGESFDVVLARAVAPLPTLVEYASPFLVQDGILIASKGIPSNDEIRSGDRAASLCGLERTETEMFDLPDGSGRRTLFVYTKVSQPSVALPRANGMAKQHPLA